MAVLMEFPTEKARYLKGLEEGWRRSLGESPAPAQIIEECIEASLEIFKRFYISKSEMVFSITGEFTQEQEKQMREAIGLKLGELYCHIQDLCSQLAKTTTELIITRAGCDCDPDQP